MRGLALLLLIGCNDGTSPDRGLDELLQIFDQDAQFRPGPFPADEGGPAAIELGTAVNDVVIGRLRTTFDGQLGPSSRAFVIGIAGVDGTWLLPAGIPDFESPDSPSATGTLGVRPEFPPGPFELMIAGSNEDGAFGAAATTELIAVPDAVPEGELVIELAWEGDADLDLHVVEPGPFGGEVFSGDPNSYQPTPGEPMDPAEPPKHGILDHDGNKDCERMPHPNEHVVWSMPPPSGEYVVRVDTPSLCGDGSAAWYVAAYRTIDGVTELIGSARGTSTPDHVLLPRGRGAGITALRFSL